VDFIKGRVQFQTRQPFYKKGNEIWTTEVVFCVICIGDRVVPGKSEFPGRLTALFVNPDAGHVAMLPVAFCQSRRSVLTATLLASARSWTPKWSKGGDSVVGMPIWSSHDSAAIVRIIPVIINFNQNADLPIRHSTFDNQMHNLNYKFDLPISHLIISKCHTIA